MSPIEWADKEAEEEAELEMEPKGRADLVKEGRLCLVLVNFRTYKYTIHILLNVICYIKIETR